MGKDRQCRALQCGIFTKLIHKQRYKITDGEFKECTWKHYLLTPCSRVLLEKLTGSAATQEIPRIFGTRNFITVLTNAATGPYPEPTPSSPYNPLPLPEDPLNIILPFASGSPQWTLSLMFPHQNPVHLSPLLYVKTSLHKYRCKIPHCLLTCGNGLLNLLTYVKVRYPTGCCDNF